MSQNKRNRNLLELINDVKDSWDYLHLLSNGKEDCLKYVCFSYSHTKKGIKTKVRAEVINFCNYYKINLVEFPYPLIESFLEFYLDFLNSRIYYIENIGDNKKEYKKNKKNRFDL
ncbi:MAG: hypothetical protein QW103_01175 [Candidatus Pacearchaeota archaeon]